MGAEHSENLLAVVFIDEARWCRRRRWWRVFAVPNVLGDIALAEVDIVVGVADVVVPNYRVGDVITGRRQGLPRAPVAWPLRVVVRAAGPRIERQRTRLGRSDASGQVGHTQTPGNQCSCC